MDLHKVASKPDHQFLTWPPVLKHCPHWTLSSLACSTSSRNILGSICILPASIPIRNADKVSNLRSWRRNKRVWSYRLWFGPFDWRARVARSCRVFADKRPVSCTLLLRLESTISSTNRNRPKYNEWRKKVCNQHYLLTRSNSLDSA